MIDRIGIFRIARDVITDTPDLVLEVMTRVIVVRAELRWDVNAIEYVALSNDFDIVDPGSVAPAYSLIAQCMIVGEDEHHEHHFERFSRMEEITPSTFRLTI